MTVDAYGEWGFGGINPGFKCTWFEGKNRKEDVFAGHLLQKPQ